MGNEPDETVIGTSAEAITSHLNILEQALAGSFLVGNTLSLADIMAGAMVYYVNMTKEGAALIQSRPKTAGWLSQLSQRESFQQSLATLLQGREQH